MKRSSLKMIIRIIILSFLFLTVLFFSGNSYLSWLFGSKYTIESAIVEHEVLPDGKVLVDETITFKMNRSYSGIYRLQPGGRSVIIENPRFEVEGGEISEIEYLKTTSKGFNAKIWLVQKGSGNKLSPSENSEITLRVSYTVRNLIENGNDISQLFWKYWGEDWNSPVKKLTGIFEFPESFKVKNIYTHPGAEIDTSGNIYTLTIDNLPPNAFAETRFVFENDIKLPYSVNNGELEAKNIGKSEDKYSRKHIFSLLFPFASFVLLTGGFFFIFRRNLKGKFKSNYTHISEILFRDSPDIVNAIINLNTIPNKDGLDALLLDLYYKAYIDFKKNKDNKPIIILKKIRPGSRLTESEKLLFNILLKYQEDGVFDFVKVKAELLKSEEKSKNFMDLLVAYRKAIAKTVEKKHYFNTAGSDYVKMYSILYFIMAFIMNFVVGSSPTQDLQFLSLIASGIFWVTGSILYLLPVKTFTSWSKKGKDYYDSWKRLEIFLKDYSLLSSYKPAEVVLWDEYLIYATALGIAGSVRKSFEKMNLDLAPLEDICDYMPGQHLLSLMDTVTTISTDVSGSSTGVGNAGNAAGGGGGGAF